MGTAPQTVDLLFARPRVFGNDLAPPRHAYFAVIPAALGFTGMLSWMLGDNLGFVLACFVATAVGLYTLWGWLLCKGPTRFSTIMGIALLLGYGGGALNTWATLPRGPMTVAEALGQDPGVLARGIGAVLLSAALLYFFGEIFEKPVFGRDFSFSIDPRTRVLMYGGALAMVAGYATHAIGFQGPSAVGGHLNPAGAFLVWLYPPLTAICVTAFLITPRGRAKVLCGLASVVLILLLTAMGRRKAIYTGVEILLVFELARYRWQGRAAHKVLMILGLGAIIVATSLTFMLLRLAGWSMPSAGRVTMGKRVEIAGKMIQNGGAYALAGSSTKENLETRTFVLGYFADILEGSSRRTPALGEELTKEVEMAIPGFLYPDKDRNYSEESLVDQQFGFGFGDEANSILTGGATDFGLLGVLIYPLLMVLLIRVLYEIVATWFGPVPLMFIALSLIYLCLQTEVELAGYFADIRLIFPFGLIIAAFLAFPSVRLRSGWD